MINVIKRILLATVITGLVLGSVLWLVSTVSGFFYTEIAVVMVGSTGMFGKQVYEEI